MKLAHTYDLLIVLLEHLDLYQCLVAQSKHLGGATYSLIYYIF